MDDLQVRWGATLALTLVNDEDGADTATLTVSQDDVVVITKTASFVDNEADLTLTAEDTEEDPGTYQYMIKVEYADGTIEKYPDNADCDSDDECELPTLEICDTNDNEGS